MKNQKGFSLVELLVVVIIIAIIAAIAIPSLLASRRAANEASAVQSLRTYHSAQSTYQATNAARDYATTPALLGNLVDNVLNGTVAGAGNPITKSGYTLTMGGVAGAATAYCAGAAPTTPGSTGTNYYGVSSGNGGVVVTDPATLGCNAATGIMANAGTPVQ